MFERWAEEHVPAFSFTAKTDFNRWKSAARPAVLATLGDMPDKVPPQAELMATWEHDGLIKQRWLINVGKHIAAVFLVNYPSGLCAKETRPAILCCHGHGAHGKEPVMGNESSPALRDAITRHNYNYGHQMAKAGYITYAIDWIGFGERNDSNKPNWHQQGASRHRSDWCDIYYLNATMLGTTPLAIHIAHGMAATDFAVTLPHVDARRLGVMGLSGGGTLTTWLAIYDDRMKAAEIICYSDLFACFAIRDFNHCGMQITPGLYKLVDLPELQGLIAPKPLLVDIGIHDTCFLIDGAMACHEQLKSIYATAGVADHLHLDLFPGEHAWGANKSIDFFGKYL